MLFPRGFPRTPAGDHFDRRASFPCTPEVEVFFMLASSMKSSFVNTANM
jgi:hypothetical protein